MYKQAPWRYWQLYLMSQTIQSGEKNLVHVSICPECTETHYVIIIITSKAHIKFVSDNSCCTWLRKFGRLLMKIAEGVSHIGAQLVVTCLTNKAVHVWVKCTNINKMSQRIP